MILHIVNKSPFEKNSLATCLRLSQPGSAILLIEDGVYAAMSSAQLSAELSSAMDDRQLYVLEPDLVLRGIASTPLRDNTKCVDYPGFVSLTVDASAVQSWL